MNTRIRSGQILIDSDGEEIEVVKVGERSVVLRDFGEELFVADIDSVLQDLASGDLVDRDIS